MDRSLIRYRTLAFPMVLSNLYFTAGLSWPSLGVATFFAWVFVIGRLLGALVSTVYKWGYFVFCMYSFALHFALIEAHNIQASSVTSISLSTYLFPHARRLPSLWTGHSQLTRFLQFYMLVCYGSCTRLHGVYLRVETSSHQTLRLCSTESSTFLRSCSYRYIRCGRC